MKKIQSFFLLILFPLYLFGQHLKPAWISDLKYEEQELFPIQLDFWGIPTVAIQVNGEVKWIQWDTGNMTGLVLGKKFTIFNDPALNKIDSIRMLDAAGNPLGYRYRYLLDSVRLFNKVWRQVVVSKSDEQYEGLVGPKFIQPSSFAIDYKNRLLAISNTSREWENKNWTRLPLVYSAAYPGLILVYGNINGIEVLIEIDTGKSRTVTDPKLLEKCKLKQGPKGVQISGLNLGGLSFDIDNGKLKSFKGISQGLEQPILLGIGSDILKQFVWAVDYESGEIWFQKK